jgi:hypothetical protein
MQRFDMNYLLLPYTPPVVTPPPPVAGETLTVVGPDVTAFYASVLYSYWNDNILSHTMVQLGFPAPTSGYLTTLNFRGGIQVTPQTTGQTIVATVGTVSGPADGLLFDPGTPVRQTTVKATWLKSQTLVTVDFRSFNLYINKVRRQTRQEQRKGIYKLRW